MIQVIHVQSMVYELEEFDGGVEASFHSPWELPKIKKSLAAIEDGHVMLETIAPYAEYTGERGCTQCGAATDDGEGWDGLCGNCADKNLGE